MTATIVLPLGGAANNSKRPTPEPIQIKCAHLDRRYPLPPLRPAHDNERDRGRASGWGDAMIGRNDPHHAAAGVDVDFTIRRRPPLPCMRWFAARLLKHRSTLPLDRDTYLLREASVPIRFETMLTEAIANLAGYVEGVPFVDIWSNV